jgi:predicted RNA binding protein YcfA (HicA-like mRNA interferase family)
MRFNELIRKLEAGGWKLSRCGKSSLRIFVKNGEKLIIHYHGNAEVPKGTAEDTLKKAGLK